MSCLKIGEYYSDRGLNVNEYFRDKGFGKGFLDVHDTQNGIIYDYRKSGTNKLSIRFTNITDSAITLEDKDFDLTVFY